MALLALVLLVVIVGYVSLSSGVDYVHGFGKACWSLTTAGTSTPTAVRSALPTPSFSQLQGDQRLLSDALCLHLRRFIQGAVQTRPVAYSNAQKRLQGPRKIGWTARKSQGGFDHVSSDEGV